MAKTYQWKQSINLLSGGYDGEEITYEGLNNDWAISDQTVGTASGVYTYRDSNNLSNTPEDPNRNSSRVAISITDNWEVRIDSYNVMTVKVSSSITNIKRDDIRGMPGVAQGNPGPGRHIWVRHARDGGNLYETIDGDITYAHTITASTIALPTIVFTLQPGGGAESSIALYYRCTTVGYEGQVAPNIYTDEFELGISFKNILPVTYRPGDRLIGGEGKSHDRNGGWAERKGYGELRTYDGGVATDDPPFIKRSDTWYNQKKVGNE